MRYDPLDYPHDSSRKVNYSKRGMVATSQPLAAQAGLRTLQKGGNAVDAAVAAASCLTVVEPTSNGLGSDSFAIVRINDELHGLNSSGPSPRDISIDGIKERGYEEMPRLGLEPVTVPGAPGAWAELSDRFGELPFEEVLEPAIEYAREGYPVSPTVGSGWRRAYKAYKKEEKDILKHWFDCFAPDGKAPEIGETWRSKDHAESLEKIARSKARSFYRGELAEKISEFSKENDGFIRKKDLVEFEPEWVEPLSTQYRGYDVWELPPNGQGIITLMALNILKGFELKSKESIESYHRQIEALKLAFVEGKKHITDPEYMDVEPEELLSEDWASEKRRMIDETAIDPGRIDEKSSDTVYLATADGEGNMVSFIQSNYMGFGSGVVVPGTGIALQNRGQMFSLDRSEANSLGPEKRSYHTIIPGFLTKDEKPIGPFGVMGGYMQPQGHLQVLTNTIDFDHNPQSALDSPRWRWIDGKKIKVENEFSGNTARALRRKGHRIESTLNKGGFGRGQIIWKEDDALVGGTEPRADGKVACW